MRVEKYNGPYMVPYNGASELVDMTRTYLTVLQLAGIGNGVENGDRIQICAWCICIP